jgi:two-component system CheB/CheR fusion protein
LAPQKKTSRRAGSGKKSKASPRASTESQAREKRSAARNSAKPSSRQSAARKKEARRTDAEVEPSVPAPAERPRFGVVGIGASAGGLEALQAFFSAMPSDSGMAFVVIQHLDPTHESLTAELLARHTAMPTVQVREEMHLEPDHVYVIPPHSHLTTSGGRLHLTEPVERRGVRVPIDFFLRSLADDQRERAVAVILSGTGTDGTLGAREIKAGGGMVMVQAPETAQYDGMPRSAINTGVVDHVLPVEKMAGPLLRYTRHWYINGRDKTPPQPEHVSDDLGAIIGLLRARTKYDFSCYKKGTLIRRIERRMSLNHLEDVAQYVEMLRQNKNEVNLLYKDLLIGVTNFFREPEAWDALQRLVIQPLVDAQPSDAPIRVWVPGCATGEEPYSIAILLFETLRKSDKACDLQIFASDIDHDALAYARAGLYPENIAADVAPERLQRFFIKGEHTYRINKEVREAVVFAEQNVISDPPFSKLDLVSCRNLLIYLEPETQKKILSLFRFALHEGGYLFLGNAETMAQQPGLFEPVSQKLRIYRRNGASRMDKLALPSVKDRPAQQIPVLPPPEETFRRSRRLATLVQQVLLARFVPACVLINQKMEVLYLHGPIDDYLQLPTGELAHDLTAMARPGLRIQLRAAVRQAMVSHEVVSLDKVRIRRGREYAFVRVVVEPLREVEEEDGVVLVTFDEADAEERLRIVYSSTPEPAVSERPEAPGDCEAIIRHLEGELRGTREDLQTTIEELETSNEEFKAANEEVTSINEELQSTNEELETSKEELQSLNEELQTVNSQLEQKISELESANNDLLNLLASTDLAAIFLDREFHLRRFTPAATMLLHVIETDLGRPIRDFAMNLADENLFSDAQRVLLQLVPAEREVHDDEGHWYNRRILPYRTEDDRIDGVVVTFSDITLQKQAEAKLRELSERLEKRVTAVTAQVDRLVDEAPDAMVVVDQQGKIAHLNKRAEELFGYSPDELASRPLDKLIPDRFRERHVRHVQDYFSHPYPRSMGTGQQLFAVTKDGKEFPADIQLSPMELNGQLVTLAAVRDVTERVRAGEVERRLATLVNASPFSIVIYRPDGTIEAWNQGAERLFGYTAAEAVGQNMQMLVPPEGVKEFWQVNRMLSPQHPLYELEAERLHKDGTRLDLAVIFSLVNDDNGNLQGICAIARDIGERKRLEQETAELATIDRQRLASQLHDTVSQQISGVSMLAASLKGQLPADSRIRAVLDHLEEAADKAKKQMGDLARGLFPVEADARGLRVALKGLADEISRMYNIPCRFECPERVEMEDNYTATHLYLIAREATYNAVRHAKPSQIVISLTEDDTGVNVSVRDDGVGMTAARPSGIGTRIMHHRCRLVRGTLTVDSAPGKGTTVTCTVQHRSGGRQGR